MEIKYNLGGKDEGQYQSGSPEFYDRELADIEAILKESGKMYRKLMDSKYLPLSEQKAKEIKQKVFREVRRWLN
jgi:hypothetical protein